MKVTLPYPISTNRYWRFTSRGVIVSREARDYKRNVRNLCWIEGWKPKDGPVSLHIQLVPSSKRHMDLDNALKITLDALQGCGYWNDKQVRTIYAEILPAEKGKQRLEVEIEEIKTDG